MKCCLCLTYKGKGAAILRFAALLPFPALPYPYLPFRFLLSFPTLPCPHLSFSVTPVCMR